jgi:hypothetical protein
LTTKKGYPEEVSEGGVGALFNFSLRVPLSVKLLDFLFVEELMELGMVLPIPLAACSRTAAPKEVIAGVVSSSISLSISSIFWK